jgi:hypothetical protein
MFADEKLVEAKFVGVANNSMPHSNASDGFSVGWCSGIIKMELHGQFPQHFYFYDGINSDEQDHAN